ncbi:MAG: hypothetical protein AB8I08_21055 [Sandaracinaceae bacterium]
MTSEPAFNEDFRDMLVSLLEAQVEFIIVGAHAMAVHGVPRATGDIDILVRPSRENAVRVLAALRAFGAPIGQHGVTLSDFERPERVYQIGLPPRRIDILTTITGVTFDEAWPARVPVDRDGLTLPFLGREQLLTNKRATGRDKDLVDVKLLRAASS